MILTDRDRQILELVRHGEALTRTQIAKAASFGSVTRVNATLLRLVRHRYLARRYQPTLAGTRRAVYVLDRVGRELLGLQGRSPTLRSSSDIFLSHTLAVNDAWLAFACLALPRYEFMRWRSESWLRALPLGLIPDGYVEYAFNGQTSPRSSRWTWGPKA
jgi:hypothetical protein